MKQKSCSFVQCAIKFHHCAVCPILPQDIGGKYKNFRWRMLADSASEGLISRNLGPKLHCRQGSFATVCFMTCQKMSDKNNHSFRATRSCKAASDPKHLVFMGFQLCNPSVNGTINICNQWAGYQKVMNSDL